LRKRPKETGWLEFKESDSNPEDIREYLFPFGPDFLIYKNPIRNKKAR